jgi:hypothetical protein
LQEAIRFGMNDSVAAIIDYSDVIPVYDNVINAIRNNNVIAVRELLRIEDLRSIEKINLYLKECELNYSKEIAKIIIPFLKS